MRPFIRLLSTALAGAVTLSALAATPVVAAEPPASPPVDAVDDVDPDPLLLESAPPPAASDGSSAFAAPPMPPQEYNGEVRAAVGPWNGYSNGQIPLDAMCSVPWDTVERFRCDAATAFTALNAEFRATFGTNISITDSYRTYDEQVQLSITKPDLAATPGTSKHGWGLAVDLGSSVNVWGSPQHNWMRSNANRFGWYHPAWAQYDGSLPEPWHWEYAGAVASGNPEHAKALAMVLVATQPWNSAAERTCLADLWQKASGWNYRAVGAGDLRGLPMASMTALYGTSWTTSSGAALYLSNPQTQIERGLRDLTTRSGSPCGASGLVSRVLDPTLSSSTVPYGSGVTLTARVAGSVAWSVEIADARLGALVHRQSGTATAATGLRAAWDGRNTIGLPVGNGTYRVTLTGTDTLTGRALDPFRTTFEVTGSQNPVGVGMVPLGSDLTFVPVTPARVLDTRTHALALGPSSRMDVKVAGVAGVPADAKAVTLNITSVHATSVSFLRAWPAGRPMPSASVLNTDANRIASGAGVVLGVGGEGKVSVFNNAGTTHLVVDVTGYYTTTTTGFGYGPLEKAHRALDTRSGGGVPSPGAPRTVQLAGTGGVPSDARAVVVNVASAASTGEGFVAVVPQGAAVTTSSVNHLPGQDVANRATVALANGKVDVHAAGGTGHVVLDVVGWYGPGASARFTPIQPIRVADTRDGGRPIGAGDSVSLPVAMGASLPSGAVAASVSMTATQQSAGATFLTAYPTGTSRPVASDLNTGSGRDQGNLVIARLGRDGYVDVYNNAGTTHLVVDVTGYFRAAGTVSSPVSGPTTPPPTAEPVPDSGKPGKRRS